MVWIAIAAGLLVGSFLGTLVTRLPEGRPIALARSACDACGHILGPRDLVPLLSWASLNGRCRYCGSPIGALPLITELGAVVIAFMAARESSGWILAASCIFG